MDVDLDGTVVLVDLDAQLAAGGEVLRLGQVALQTVVLHRLGKGWHYFCCSIDIGKHTLMSIYACTYVHVVIHADQPPLVLVVLVLVAGPDLLKVRHDVVAAGRKFQLKI